MKRTMKTRRMNRRQETIEGKKKNKEEKQQKISGKSQEQHFTSTDMKGHQPSSICFFSYPIQSTETTDK